jgi:hypothetical protein
MAMFVGQCGQTSRRRVAPNAVAYAVGGGLRAAEKREQEQQQLV